MSALVLTINGHPVQSVELSRDERRCKPNPFDVIDQWELYGPTKIKALVPLDSPVRLLSIGQEVEVEYGDYKAVGVLTEVEVV